MKEVYLPPLFELAKELGRLVRHYEDNKPTEKMPEADQKKSKEIILAHADTFGKLDMQMCKLGCERIAARLDEPYKETSSLFSDLVTRMYDECRLRTFLT